MLDAGEVAVAPAHEVQQSARRGDDDVGSPSERLDLGLLAHASEDRGYTEGQVLGIRPDILVDLDHQFAGRGQDQRPDVAGAGVTGRQTGEQRQGEGGGLAGSRLRDADEILAGEDDRDRRSLDRCRFGVAGVVHGAEHARV